MRSPISQIRPEDLCTDFRVKDYLRDNPDLKVIATKTGQLFLIDGQPIRLINHLLNLYRNGVSAEITETIIDLPTYDTWLATSGSSTTGEQQIQSDKIINERLQVVLTQAIKTKASDIYLDVFKEQDVTSVSYKVFGYRRQVASYTAHIGLALCRSMWSKASNATFEEGRPCDCAFTFKYQNKNFRIRANNLPDIRGSSIVCRIRDPNLVLPLEECGYSAHQWRLIQRLAKLPGGLILISGETNSGKSTTLTSLMQEMPDTHKIIEVADPVEVLMPHVTHVELNRYQDGDNELYQRIQAAIVRQNPDVLILGEIRDEITAAAAMSMAIQGKKVYSTLHSQSCLSAIPRLENLGVDPNLLGLREFLGGVISQNLVPLICSHCALVPASNNASHAHYQRLFGDSIKFINPNGCEHCFGGVRGQTLVAEIYPFALDRSGQAHKLIAAHAFVELERYMKEKYALDSKHDHAATKITAGLIDPAATENIIGEFPPPGKTIAVLHNLHGTQQEGYYA